MHEDRQFGSEGAVPIGVVAAALDRAFAARRAGVWDGFGPDDEIDAAESYARAVEQFDAVVRGLTEREWLAPVVTYGSTHDLVAHLLAIEIYTGKQVGLFDRETIGADHDHVGLADELRDQWRTADHLDVLAAWRDHTRQIVETLRRDARFHDAAASWHGATIDVHALLVIRTFELWTHADDVRAAIGRPRGEPDNAQLKLMTNLAAEILPLGLELTGRPHAGRTLRLVLTGRGGGTWRCPLAASSVVAAHDDVVIVADAVEFCRLAANRCTPDALDAYVEGDEAIAADILRGMVALAAD
ncbi:MAG: maleylpyruvate isomerase family mycothiol-dependent enzyme [Acidimicrobiales bacterium]